MDNSQQIIDTLIHVLKKNNYILRVNKPGNRCIVSDGSIPTKINDYWDRADLCNLYPYILDNEKQCRLDFTHQMMEKVWNACDTDSRKDIFNVLGKLFVDNIFNEINTVNSDQYLNQAIIYNYTKNDFYNSLDDEIFSNIIKKFSNTENVLQDETLQLMCKKESYFFKKLKNQRLLKDLVENYMPNSVEIFKKYWKKIDTSDIIEDTFEQTSYALSFNKKVLYDLAPQQNAEFFSAALKSLVSYFNKPATTEILGLDRVMFDGTQENQTAYHFVVLGFHGQYDIKSFLKNVVPYVVQLTEDFTIKDLEKIVNHARLEQKLDTENGKNIKRPKI